MASWIELCDDDLVPRLERPREGVLEQEVDRRRVGSEHYFLDRAPERICLRVGLAEESIGGLRGDERASRLALSLVRHSATAWGDGVGRPGAARPIQIDHRRPGLGPRLSREP